MFERFTDKARQVVTRAGTRSDELRLGAVGEEGLLLALLEQPDLADPAALLVGRRDELTELAAALRTPREVVDSEHRPLTPYAKRTLELSLREALAQQCNYIGLRHLLLGALRAAAESPDSNLVALMLARLDIDVEQVRQALLVDFERTDRETAAREKELAAIYEERRGDPSLCLFCKIVAGEEPASRVYEDELVLAFLDVQPINPGHVLVVPKQHQPLLADVGEDLTAHLFRIAHRVAAALRRSDLRCSGVGITMADGTAAGQEIPHSHVHVYPRNPGDGYRVNAHWWVRDRAVLDETAAKVRAALEAG